MRYVCPATVVALSILTPAAMFGQLTITNYKLVSQQMVTLTQSNCTYSAQVQNTGTALYSVTATAISTNPTVAQILPNQGTLTFGSVPANGVATSTNTFTILLNQIQPFTGSVLQWSFQSTPAAPVANAGSSQPATIQQQMFLNGGGSTNPSGVGTLTYQWTFLSRPSESSTVLANPTSVTPSFTVDVGGNYVIQLTVSNGVGSSTADVTVTTTDVAPVANAGPNQTVLAGTTVTLTGAGSSDANSDLLTFNWSLTSVPTGSTPVLIGATTVSPTFFADSAGTYTAQLVVNDGILNSTPSTVTISTINTPPVANAGPNQVVGIGPMVQLDGSGSTDVDGNPLTYQWRLITLPTNSTAVLSSTTAVNPTFVADMPGTYVAQLTVHDGSVASTPVTVTLTTNAPLAPTANAGANQSVAQNTLVSLSGSGTDPQGFQLNYTWSFASKPGNSKTTLSGANAATPTFLADEPGTYTVQLIVNDGFLSSTPSTVMISTADIPPVANPGSNQNVMTGSTVTLNGNGSTDTNGATLAYSWTFNSVPTGSAAALSGAATASPTFVADLAGVYVVQLIVNDGLANSTPQTVTITAMQTPASITAVSGAGQTATVGQAFTNPFVVTVKDAVGNLVSGATVTFTAPAASGASGTFAPSGAATSVVRTNASGLATSAAFAANTISGSGTVSVSVSPGSGAASFGFTNKPGQASTIVATSGMGQSVKIGATFTLVATVTDTYGNPVSGSQVTFTGPMGSVPGSSTAAATSTSAGLATVTLTANNVFGTYNVTASGSGMTSATFSITNTNGNAASISIASGSGQSTQVTKAYANPLVVVVKDIGGNPVSNQSVTFSALSSGPSGTFTPSTGAATTNASGQAQITFTANTTAGVASIQAAVGSLTLGQNTFVLTNTPAAAAAISAVSGGGQMAHTGVPFANPLVALVQDQYGNAVSGATVTFTNATSAAKAQFSDDPNGTTSIAVSGSNGQATSYSVIAGSTPGGPYAVTANITPPAATAAQFSLTNTVTGTVNGTVTLGPAPGEAMSVGQNMVTLIQLNLSTPVTTSNFNVTVTTDGVNLLLGNGQGVQTEQIPIAVGSSSAIFSIQGLSNIGQFPITVDAPGYQSLSTPATVNVTPSGFILSGPDGAIPLDITTLTTYQNVPTTLFIYAVQLDSNGNILMVNGSPALDQGLRGGNYAASVPIAVQGSSQSVGTITSPVSITGYYGTATFTATNTGAGTIALGQATGFSQASAANTTLPVVVGGAGIAMPSVTIGNNLETSAQLTLNGVAPACGSPGYVYFTVTSNNYPALSLSNSTTGAGTNSIQVPVACGGSASGYFAIQVTSATVGQQLTFTANGSQYGFAASTGTVTVGKSGFVLGTGNGGSPLSGNFFRSTVTGPTETIDIYSYLLDSSGNPLTPQLVAPGTNPSAPASVTVNVISDNTTNGTVNPNQVVIAGGNYTVTTIFTPLVGGTPASPNIANVNVTTPIPSGFTAASSAYASVQALILNPSFGINDGAQVGQFLQTYGTVSIGVPQDSDVQLQLTVTNGSGQILLSTNGTDGGFSTIYLTIPAHSYTASYAIYGLTPNGTAIYTVSSVSGPIQYTPRSSPITLEPSGIALGAVPIGTAQELLVSLSNPAPNGQQASFNVEVGILNGDGSFYGQQGLMGGAVATANVSVSGSGTIGSPGVTSLPVTIQDGNSQVPVPFNPTATGSATISLGSVTGVTTASSQSTVGVVIQP